MDCLLDALGVRDSAGQDAPDEGSFHTCLQGRGGFGKRFEAEGKRQLGGDW